MRHTATLVTILALGSTSALAQTSATKPPVPYNQVLSTNPFGLLFNWFNVEFERKIAPATTFGVTASHIPSLDHSNAALVMRWYPRGAALEGLYLGARAGAYGFETYEVVYPNPQAQAADPNHRSYPTYQRRTMFQPGAGMEIGYNWLLGPKQNVSLGLGFGLTRILTNRDWDGYVPVIPNPRVVTIGIAF
jgi:hypothetical protein